MVSEWQLLDSVKVSAIEIMRDNPEALDLDQLERAIDETADSLVNVYTYDCLQEWLAAGMPEAEEYGIDTGGTIIEQVMACMFFWYRERLTEEITELLEARIEQGEGE